MAQQTENKPLLGNRYELLQTLGTGGMAFVYKAKDVMLERMVAIKVLREDYSKNDAFRESFRSEARAAANLSHPNIVTVFDFGLDHDRLFLVMEYIPGTDLKSILKQKLRLPVEQAVDLMIQAASGIGYAHRAGIVHCDIKPHNMLVTPDNRLKVTDFGIARAIASVNPDEKHEVVWGSPLYFSPEQASGKPPSPASDVYSLGVVLYEMLTGHLPFESQNPEELAKAHREQPPLNPRRYNMNIPTALEQIIMKVLAKEPSARYRTADQFARVLKSFIESYSQSQPSAQFDQPVSVSIVGPVRQVNDTNRVRINPKPIKVEQPSPVREAAESFRNDKIDWLTTFLALITVIAVGGLIPFALYVFYTFNPPVP
ncbi:MAG TPA: protein kinase [Bellilinea sp.]|nr:protein kinase [Bellilinea sp.]